MRRIIFALFIVVYPAVSQAVCTGTTTIVKLAPREGGWIHVVGSGISDMDINGCGVHSEVGMLLNFGDSSGTLEGKKMLLSTLLTAFSTGKTLSLCSNGCDSQHPSYSRLSHIDELVP